MRVFNWRGLWIVGNIEMILRTAQSRLESRRHLAAKKRRLMAEKVADAEH